MNTSFFQIRCLMFLILGTVGSPSYSWAATINAASCSQANVQTAINSASDADTVTVPAGNCTWSAAVSITKPVILQGAGNGLTGGTTITYGGTSHTLISVNPGSKTGKVDISGFYFVGGDTNYWGGMAIEFEGPVGWKNFRIHDNRFNNNIRWTLRGASYIDGLIDHNIFQGTAAGMIFRGQGDTDWTRSLVLGSDDFFFVEDNTFNWNNNGGSTGAPTVDMENGGRYVFRHNTVVYGMVETHDFARNGAPSSNAWEIYSNTFSRPDNSNGWKGLDMSAGTGVIWGNTFTGDYSVAIGAIDYKSFDPRNAKLCNGTDPLDQNTLGQTGWLCQYQLGSQGLTYKAGGAYQYPVYMWNNTKNGASVGMTCTAGCTHLQVGRDFINNGSTPKPGYTPYTYPHPLTQVGSTTDLQPPSNLQVN